MERELRIMVACGSGVATSTIAMDSVSKILDGAGIKAIMYKGTLGELESKQKDVDLILVTTNYKKELEVPILGIFGLISGVNSDLVKTKIVDSCKEIMKRSK